MIGRRIREVRQRRKLTQEQLGARVGKTEKTMSSWENGRSEIGLLDILRLCNALNTSADHLLCLTDQEADLRVRSDSLHFIDRAACESIEDAQSLSEIEEQFSAGFLFGSVLSPSWELVDEAEWEDVQRKVTNKLNKLGGYESSWIASVLERRQRNDEGTRDA